LAVSFSIPKSVPRSVMQMDTFLGVDFTNSPANVDDNKSPNAVNMIRDVPGKVRKRMGYSLQSEYDARINGFYYRRGDDEPLVHSGTNLYKGTEKLYEDAADATSHAWQFGEYLYIMDGKKLLRYDGEEVVTVESVSYVPTLTIGKEPGGGGTQYEDLNLLQPGFEELFLSDGTSKTYCLTFGELDEKEVEVSFLDANGEWQPQKEGTDFTVDRTAGTVTFVNAPGESPITGEDNVSIVAYRSVDGYADRINHCTIGIRFGVNGAQDRLFVSGNDDFCSYDWFSQQWDPSYYADTSYSNLGSSGSAIVGYSIISNYLAAHKDEMEADQSIILRQGDLVDNEPAFRIINTLNGAGSIAKNSFAYLATEPMFLTRSGIYAITAQDITGDKYAQRRSFFLNGKLLDEPNLEEAYACVFNDMYWLCVNDVVYILDGLQALRTDKSDPYATRQYAGFYLTNIPARCMWVYKGELYFGSKEGKIYKFYTEKEALDSYSDDGQAIEAIWETPDLSGKLFYKNKTFRFLSVELGASLATSIEVWAMKRGIWGFLKSDHATGRYLSFENLIFSKFSFSCNKAQRLTSSKISIKKVDKARFRFMNKELKEPFLLFAIALEYQENGNYKG